MNKNNVHVSGIVLNEEIITSSEIKIVIGIEEALTFPVVIQKKSWEKFKKIYPECKSVTFFGQLRTFRKSTGSIEYSIEASSVSCFHNILQDSLLNESGSQFHGIVTLQKKFDFEPESKLFLKRMVFKTDDRPVYLEATALRSIAPYFEDINEGEKMILRANYMFDNHQPYWRIKHRPVLI